MKKESFAIFTRPFGKIFGRGSEIVKQKVGRGSEVFRQKVMLSVKGSSAILYVRDVRRRFKRTKTHYCLDVLKRLYHRYGLKHVVLVFSLLLYTFFGAFLFVLIEEPSERNEKRKWEQNMAKNRTIFVDNITESLLNNTVYYLFATQMASIQVNTYLNTKMESYEKQMGVKFSTQKIEWDYWNAMLYTITIFTTIGYGHIYPKTSAGRILTMIYAICGIPLVLTILNDLGKLLTVGMKYPWFLTKKCYRRIKRLCTKTPMKDILAIEKLESDNLQIFDIPIPVAIGLIIGWIFACSSTFCIWETRWSFLEAFYFFFISLSTIGLGDIIPDHPKNLLLMFPYIIIGLSLVSMSINLIQSRMEQSYQSGSKAQQLSTPCDEVPETLVRPALGIIQAFANVPNVEYVEDKNRTILVRNQHTQTEMSFPLSKFLLITNDGKQRVVNTDVDINSLSLTKSLILNGPRQRSLTVESPTLEDIVEENSLSD